MSGDGPDETGPQAPETSYDGRDTDNVGLSGDARPPAEEVVDDEDLTLPGSLESIEGTSASPDPEDPDDPSPAQG